MRDSNVIPAGTQGGGLRDTGGIDQPRRERDTLVGTILDRRFRIEERIAAGGFGAIYRATHVKSGYEVAIKILHPHMSADEQVVARFRREGATLTQLRDPHTVTTYELAVDRDGTLFIVMELLRGETLLHRFRTSGPQPWQQVVAIGRAVCDSLAEAHAMGVVHRDLKPGNIFLKAQDDGTDFVKVLDFGIAKLLQGSDIDGGSEELTKHNEVLGTFEYVSPEQVKGAEYSGRSDIYTLGVVMYEMISGTRPFALVNGPALLVSVLMQRPVPLSERMAGLPAELDRVLAKCLEPDPEARFHDVRELAATLDLLVPPDSITVRPPDSLDEATNFLVRDTIPTPPDRAISRLPYATPVPAPPVVPIAVADRPSAPVYASHPAIPPTDRPSQPIPRPRAPTAVPPPIPPRPSPPSAPATIPDRPSFHGFDAPAESEAAAAAIFTTAQGWQAPSRPSVPLAPPALLPPPMAVPPPEPAPNRLWIVILLAAIVVGVVLAIAI